MFVTEKDIEECVAKILGENPQRGYAIWGVIMPSKVSQVLLGNISILMMKYHILYFCEKGIVIIGVDTATGRLIPDKYVVILKEDLEDLKFEKKLMGYQLNLNIKGKSISYKVNKTMIGAKWHKGNLEKIRNHLEEKN